MKTTNQNNTLDIVRYSIAGVGALAIIIGIIVLSNN